MAWRFKVGEEAYVGTTNDIFVIEELTHVDNKDGTEKAPGYRGKVISSEGNTTCHVRCADEALCKK